MKRTEEKLQNYSAELLILISSLNMIVNSKCFDVADIKWAGSQ